MRSPGGPASRGMGGAGLARSTSSTLPQASADRDDASRDEATLELEGYVADRDLEVQTLRELSGHTDLSRATKLTLKADANELPLSSLLSHVPGLLELNLNGSILTSPRDIGSGLSRLRVLWVCRCSLPTLQGLGSLSCLEELYASFNDIQDLSPLGDLEYLAVADLEGNCVSSLDEVAFLSLCQGLQNLTLVGNPVSRAEQYRRHVCSAVRALQTLDDAPVTEDDRAEPTVAFSVPEAREQSGGRTPEGEGDAAGEQERDDVAMLLEEMDMVMDGLRYARVGIDALTYGLEAEGGAGPSGRPQTAVLRPKSSRSWGAGRSGGGAALVRPSTAAGKPPRHTGVVAGEATGYRGTAGAARDGAGPLAAPLKAEGLFWRKNRLRDIRSAGDAEDSTAAGSELTQGDAMAGSLAKSLRGKRRDGTGAPGSQRQGTEIGDLGHEGLLEQLRQFKISLSKSFPDGNVPKELLSGHLSGSDTGSDADEEILLSEHANRGFGPSEVLTVGGSPADAPAGAVRALPQDGSLASTAPIAWGNALEDGQDARRSLVSRASSDASASASAAAPALGQGRPSARGTGAGPPAGPVGDTQAVAKPRRPLSSRGHLGTLRALRASGSAEGTVGRLGPAPADRSGDPADDVGRGLEAGGVRGPEAVGLAWGAAEDARAMGRVLAGD